MVGEPTFTSYELAARTMGATAVRVPLRDYLQDVPAMLEAVGERTKYAVLCSPLNPTGTAVNKVEIEEMLSSLPVNVLLVLDEAYVEYVTDPGHPDSLTYLEDHPNLVIARTFSKVYGLAGLRVGYVVTSKPVRDALEKVKLPFNVNRIAQVAALAALGDDEHVAHSRELNRRGKERLYRVLEETGFEYVPTQANFILVKNGPHPDLFRRLIENCVIVREGEAIGVPGHVRITIGDDAQNDMLERALRAGAVDVRNAWPLWIFPAVTAWPEEIVLLDPAGCLTGLDDLAAAADRMIANVRSQVPGVTLTHFLMEPMQPPPLAEIVLPAQTAALPAGGRMAPGRDATLASGVSLTLTSPDPARVYRLSRAAPADTQQIEIAAQSALPLRELTLTVNGRPLWQQQATYASAWWQLQAGEYTFQAIGITTAGETIQSAPITITVIG